MNILKRTLIILVVALGVMGVTVAVTQWGGTSNAAVAGDTNRPQFTQGGATNGFRGEGDRGGGGLVDVFKNLFLFGLIGAVVVAASLAWDGLQKTLRPAQPVLADDPLVPSERR
jgi:hypothetical protein